ncbi:prion-inhibition and propagation-domain-containing protein [Cadophora sp. MPI-SDFR-AT-0126]|nr:prion-inhibition and propagation-domain-containing protein [Leotiomycetes sp. MPI-SDFR-AT-0126]
MAEAFGIVAGAMGIAGLFNNCVDCFEYVQMARNFGRDFNSAQLRLDFAKLNLSRWGQVVNINDNPQLSDERLAREALWQILVLFSNAAEVSSRFKSSLSQVQPLYDPDIDTSVDVHHLHHGLRRLTRQRRKVNGLFSKVSWALYQSKNLDRLITNITDHVDDLYKLIPAADAGERLPLLLAEEVASFDQGDLQLIETQAENTDELLREAVKVEIERLRGHRTGNVKIGAQAKVRVGDEYSDSAIQSEYKPGHTAGASTGNVDATDESRMHVGHSYGGPSVMGD